MSEPLEVTVARLDERLNGFTETMKQMADDQRRLTDSYEKLVESNQRIALVETDLVNLKKSNETLWAKFDSHVQSQHRVTGHALFEIVKLLIALILGALAAKYGIHLA